MTPAEQQHAMEFDLDEWHQMIEDMETREHVAEQADSDEAATARALRTQEAEAQARINAVYYAGDESEVGF